MHSYSALLLSSRFAYIIILFFAEISLILSQHYATRTVRRLFKGGPPPNFPN